MRRHFFREPGDALPGIHRDEADVTPMIGMNQCDGRAGPPFDMSRQQRRQIDPAQRIAVGHYEEIAPDPHAGMAYRSGRSQWRCFPRKYQLDLAGMLRIPGFKLITQMPSAQNGPPDALPHERIKHEIHEWARTDHRQRLGSIDQDRA
ncbi:hypothetical protein COMA2_10162 [Candidatus Nitrospira nitrificans]|uniref:Uncharacterized protein n=1 Tax=Candidatus Nitrospira nitrificans TaxID=1742973 RepID=A0A0S4L1K3_9BACT|nr:hypothetical protein COMA2_10162 [Candidatus Nitrospira nitrificans]